MSEPWWQVGFLGIVQGLTEFLPISSSGHLVLAQHFLGIHEPQLLLDVVLHGGTLGAILAVFRIELMEIIRGLIGRGHGYMNGSALPPGKVVLYLFLATVVTGAVALVFRDVIESLFSGVGFLGPFWLLTGSILWLTRWAPSAARVMGPWDAILIGLAQALALAPGVSRSGITIAVGLLLGWERRWAATFSFLLSIPAISGALLLEGWRGEPNSAGWGLLLLGGLSSLVVGWASLRWLLRLVLKGKLHRFAWYCWILGASVAIGGIFAFI